MIRVLKAIEAGMETAGVNYAFMEWQGKPEYPYFTGEYHETGSLTEDGLREMSFTLTGFTRGPWTELEKEKEKILDFFDPMNGHIVTVEKSTVAVFYENAFPVQTGDAELKKMQINLTVKEWSVK